jgi:hypothetical protein
MATKVKLYDEDGHIVGFQDAPEGGGGSSSAKVEIIDVYLDNGQTEIEKSVAEMFVQKIIDGTVCFARVHYNPAQGYEPHVQMAAQVWLTWYAENSWHLRCPNDAGGVYFEYNNI